MKHIVGLLLWILVPAAATFGQESVGQVLGTVTDQTGAAISGVRVTLSGTRVPNGLTTTSGADGSYLFAAVPIGVYELTVSQAGFVTLKREAIQVQLGSKITINPSLKI